MSEPADTDLDLETVPDSSPAGFSLCAVVNDFPAPSQTFIRRKLAALSSAGVEVSVAATRFSAGAASDGYRQVETAPWRTPSIVLTTSGREEVAAIARSIVKRPPRLGELKQRLILAPFESIDSDIVHFEFSGLAVTYLDALDGLARNSRLVVSCRGAAEQIEPLRNPARAEQLAAVFSAVDLIHCVSDDIAATARALGAPENKILVNRPAVPVAGFAPLRRSPGTLRDGPLQVLSVGRLHWKKGLDDGLRSIAALRQRGIDVRYRVAGGGDQHEKLSFMIDQLGLTNVVELLGTCTEDTVKTELGRCDVVLLPSLSEGISNAVLEAMAAGRCVVTTDCGGMSEVVTDGVDGFVVGIGDTAAMTDRLEQLANDPGLLARLSNAAAERADVDFDIERQLRLFLGAYRDLLS